MKNSIYITKRLVFYLSLLYLIFIFQGKLSLAQVSFSDNYVRTRTYINPTSTQTNVISVLDVEYQDGFGRPIQSIAVNANPAANADIIIPFQYGVHGRTEKEYLPYVKTANQGRYDANSFAVSNWSLYGNSEQGYAFSKIEYDNSPLNRVIKETGSGAAWHTNNKAVTTEYISNRANRVYKWDVTNNSLTTSGYYAVNTLQGIRQTNEDGYTTETYTDSQGRIILQVTVNGTENWDTYYVYDIRGNLCYVIPPEASARIASGTLSTTILNEYAYCYKYDEWGRMIEKKLPGCDVIYYVYDKYDNLVFMQDGNRRTISPLRWFYFLYDSQHRVIQKWDINLIGNYNREQLQANVNAVENYSPSGSKIFAEICAYDNYVKAGHYFLPFSAENGYASSYCKLLTGHLTARRVLDMNADTPVYETYYYDDKMRLIQFISSNHMGGISRTSMAYDFVGNLIKTRERHSRPGTTEDILETTFTYDNRGRLLSEKAVLNNTGALEINYTYDALGRVTAKTYGTGNNSYTETFSYNTRDWLTSIDGNLFSQKLRYTDPQLGNKSLYSGNISEWEWGHASTSTNAYGFDYDNVGRLKNASFFEKNGVNWTKNDRFTEKNITYDKHGNILTLSRTYGADIQTFNYTYSGNRLSSVSGGLSGSYEYNKNGTLTKDNRRGLTLHFNKFNCLDRVEKNGTIIAQYFNRSDGVRLRVRDGAGQNGFDYLGSLTYITTNGVTSLEGANFNDGIIKKDGTSYKTLYYLKDHLGSVRALLNPSTKQSEVNYTYYPFGKNQVSTTYKTGDNRYRYNGKEEQVIGDLGYLDYGARFYDTELGRWISVDPMAEEYINLSPYNYVLNNPALYIDVWGLFPGQNEPPAKHIILPEFTVTAPGPLFWGSIMAEWEFAGTWSQYIGLYPEFENLNADEAQKLWREKYSTLYFDWWEASVKAERAAQTTQQLVWFMKAFTSIGTVVAPGAGLKGGGTGLSKFGSELGKGFRYNGEVFTVTPNGVVLPKGIKIPTRYIENSKYIGSYGIKPNGRFLEKLRIDAGTAPGMKGPNISHFHLNNKSTHYFDLNKWPK